MLLWRNLCHWYYFREATSSQSYNHKKKLPWTRSKIRGWRGVEKRSETPRVHLQQEEGGEFFSSYFGHFNDYLRNEPGEKFFFLNRIIFSRASPSRQAH
jgi:hypothetical protein